MQETCETRVRSLGGEDPLEEEMATHSSIPTWRIPCPTVHGVQRIGHDWVTEQIFRKLRRYYDATNYNSSSKLVLSFLLKKAFFLSVLFSRTLHSVGYIFPFLLCRLLLFFSQLFVRPNQATTLPSCISFSLGWYWSPPPVQCYKLPTIVLQELCLPDLILVTINS